MLKNKKGSDECGAEVCDEQLEKQNEKIVFKKE